MNNDFDSNTQYPTSVNESDVTTKGDGYVYRWDASQPAEAKPHRKKLGGVAVFGIVLAVAYAVAAIILAVVLAMT